MEELTRYFFSPVLGRGKVWATFQESGNVTVELNFSTSSNDHKITKFVASKNDISIFRSSPVDVLFTLCRIAISQIQADRSTNSMDGDKRLDIERRPWNGDLMDYPFGGATIGCARLHREPKSE